ncbi:hypothetical protein BW41_00721 [Sphingomonas sp. RIT328]|nr:hypothetical protein BW41_00721 [Sphingomonas sp. RIT328]
MACLARRVAGGERGGTGERDGGGGLGLRGGGRLFGGGGGGDRGVGGLCLGARGVGGGGGLAPAREDRPRLGDADLFGQRAIAFGGTRLPPQMAGARILIGDQLVEPQQIGLGRAQFLFGVAAADVQAGDPRRILQHRAPFGRLGGDHRADPVLADQRRTVRAGRRIGEEQADVLGADVAPVDAIGAAGAALDAAHDLALGDLAAGDGRVEQDRHFGEIARRPRRGAGEDDVLHPHAAQRLGAVLAHRPAQRFEQVGLAAAVRPDDAGQPALDDEVDRIDEALEPGDAKPLDLHRLRVPLLTWRGKRVACGRGG